MDVDDRAQRPVELLQREEAARQALRRFELARERAFRRRLLVAAMLGLPAVLAVAWFLGVGWQRHVLEIRSGDAALRLVSREGPYQLDVPNDPELADFVRGGSGAVVEEHHEGTTVRSRAYDWASYARTEQVVTREPGDPFPMDFILNGRRFRFAGAELQSAGRRWLLRPGRTLEINVDQLPRPVGGAPFLPSVFESPDEEAMP
jgi:hypothetical protein